MGTVTLLHFPVICLPVCHMIFAWCNMFFCQFGTYDTVFISPYTRKTRKLYAIFGGVHPYDVHSIFLFHTRICLVVPLVLLQPYACPPSNLATFSCGSNLKKKHKSMIFLICKVGKTYLLFF